MNQDNNKKYEITEYRQNQLLRLRKYFTQSLYDQIPQMMNLYRSLENMSLMTYGNTLTVNPFIVEMVPILSGNKMFKLSDEEIKKIGNQIVKDYFENLSREKLAKELEPVNDIYNLDNIEYFMEDPICAQCGKLANSRCSRCKSEWYCSKECQIKRWKEHKALCKSLANLFKDEGKDLSKKKIEFNHIKVTGNNVSQELSNNLDKNLDLNEIKNENKGKVLVEELKKDEKTEKNNREGEKDSKKMTNEDNKDIKTTGNIEEKIEHEKKNKDKNELDELD